MTIHDEQLNILSKSKHDLIRKYDLLRMSERKKIDDISYIEELKKINEQLENRVRIVIKQDEEQEGIKMKEEESKTETPVVEKAEEVKVGKKIQESSYASIIAKALEMKTVKNIDEVIAKVDELKPGRDKSKIKTQVKAIIREVKAGKGRWTKYTWNDEEFLLKPKA